MDSKTIIIEDITYHCRTQPELHKFSYTWSIANFWLVYKYVIEIYSDKVKNYFRLYACLENDHLRFYALVDRDDNREQIAVSYSVFLNTTEGEILYTDLNDINYLFADKYKELLCELSISHLKINSKKYLPNGTLTIRFRFLKYGNLFNSSLCYSHKPEVLVTDMQSFVSDEKSNSLVTFVIREKHLQANKVLLCLKSKVFEAMFNCNLKESINNRVEITDIKYDILQQLLTFIQTGYLSENIRTDTKVARKLFIAAEKYDIKDLKLICEQYLITNTTKENVVEHLKLAHLNNATVLNKFALDLIKLHLKDIGDTPNFITLMQEYHELLIQMENIKLPVIETKYT